MEEQPRWSISRNNWTALKQNRDLRVKQSNHVYAFQVLWVMMLPWETMTLRRSVYCSAAEGKYTSDSYLAYILVTMEIETIETAPFLPYCSLTERSMRESISWNNWSAHKQKRELRGELRQSLIRIYSTMGSDVAKDTRDCFLGRCQINGVVLASRLGQHFELVQGIFRARSLEERATYDTFIFTTGITGIGSGKRRCIVGCRDDSGSGLCVGHLDSPSQRFVGATAPLYSLKWKKTS
ncbi:hypothetical protein J6590_086010 [Homalodisca vitripennis]|nr:hypothetical protein J6590_086010 [Homalodisca vitripennis]